MQSPFSLVLVKPALMIFLPFDTTLEGLPLLCHCAGSYYCTGFCWISCVIPL